MTGQKLVKKAGTSWGRAAWLWLGQLLANEGAEEMSRKSDESNKRVRRWRLAALAVCVILLALAVGILLRMYQARNNQIFHELIEDNLVVTHQVEVQEIKASVQETQRVLESMAAVYRTNDESPESTWGQSYLLAIRELNEFYDITYFSAETMHKVLVSDLPGPNRDIIARLLQGETVISEIFRSDHLGDTSVFSVAVPVVQHGEVIGAYRSLLRGDLLIGAKEETAEAYENNYLLKRNGDFILDGTAYVGGAYNLLTDLKKQNVAAEKVAEIAAALAAESEDQLIYLEDSEHKELFLVISSLGYNDWRMLSVARLSDIKDYSASIMQNTLVLIGALLVFLALLLGSVGWFLNTQRQRIRHEQARYDLLAKFSDTILFEYDYRTQRMVFTPNIASRFTFEKGEIRPMDEAYCFQTIHPEDQGTLRAFLNHAERLGEDSQESTMLRFLDKNDEYRWMDCQGQLLRDKAGRPLALIGKISDVHEQKEQEERLLEKASLDAMTGVLNRGAAEREINRLLEQVPAGFLFMVDVDNFKQINDTYGHARGDAILIQTAADIKSAFRQGDVVGRIGGDEFVIFMQGASDQATAAAKAEHILERLSLREEGALSVSIGIAVYPQSGESYAALYEAADQAMYAAKRQGKSGYHLADTLQ